jgi:carbon monoxide dehydrogenase subunit G
VTFTITPDGPGTRVNWAMTGQSTYLQKVFGTIFNMDKTVGGEFDKGLANLKTLAES